MTTEPKAKPIYVRFNWCQLSAAECRQLMNVSKAFKRVPLLQSLIFVRAARQWRARCENALPDDQPTEFPELDADALREAWESLTTPLLVYDKPATQRLLRELARCIRLQAGRVGLDNNENMLS